MKILKILALSLAPAAMALPAMASPVSVELEFNGLTASRNVDFGPTPVTPYFDPAAAGGFRMSDASGTLEDFVAWCLDIAAPLGTSGTHGYQAGSSLSTMTQAALGRIQSLFDSSYGSVDVGNSDQAAGFQMALWDTLYDDDFDIGGGDFQVSAMGSNNANSFAGSYLGAAATYTGPHAYDLSFFESTEAPRKQNLVTATAPAPVPLPAAAWLLTAALGGLGVAGRRRG